MKKINKKGFTIVELVIVIAVIAILAAVLIPTFSSLVKTAQTSSDVNLVKNLNTSLTTSEILDGKNETITDALNDVKEDGFDVTKLTPTNSDNEILWDEESNRFVLYVDEEYESCGSDVEVDESKLYKLWKIYNEVEELESNPVYSIYWNVDADLPEGTKLSVGFDAGTTKNVSEVFYENTSTEAKEVVIRTNGGTLTIDDSSTGTIKHYGDSDFLNIIQCAIASYHEYGFVNQAQIKKGRVVNEVFEEDEKGIQNLFLIANTSNSFDDIIVGAAEGAKLPDLDRTDVTIPEGGVLVVKVEEGVKAEGDSYSTTNDDYVYLYKSGISEQILTSDTKVENGTITGSIGETVTGTSFDDSNITVTFTVGTSQIDNDDSKTAATQIANIPTGIVTDYNSDEIVVEQKATIEDVELAQGDNAMFAGGAGSKGNPYLITSEDWWFKFAQLCKEDSDYSETNGKYFKVTSDINVGKYESGTLNILYFAGNIDFNNHKLFGWNDEIITDGIGAYVGAFDQLSNATIQNLDFYTCVLEENSCQFPITSESRGVCVLKNCNVYGNCDPVNWNNTGFFVVYPRGSSLTLENCNNYANLINSGYSSAFIGRILVRDCNIYFKNCNNYANIISTNSGASMLIANPCLPSYVEDKTCNIHIENCNNYGVICGNEDYMNLVIPTQTLYPNPSYTLLIVNGININTKSSSQAERYDSIVQSIEDYMSGTNVAKLRINSLSTTNGYFDCAEIANAAKYVLSFGFTPSNRNGARYGYNMTFDKVPEKIKVGSWIAKSELDVNATIDAHMGEGTEYYTSGDYYVYHDDQGTILDKVKVAYIVYGNDGNIIYLASYTYQD